MNVIHFITLKYLLLFTKFGLKLLPCISHFCEPNRYKFINIDGEKGGDGDRCFYLKKYQHPLLLRPVAVSAHQKKHNWDMTTALHVLVQSN